MDGGLSLSKVIEEIRVLLLEESFFLYGMDIGIERIIDELWKESSLIETNDLPYALSDNQRKAVEKMEKVGIEAALDAKKAIIYFIFLKAYQKRRRSMEKLTFFFKDFRDRRRAARKLIKMSSQIHDTIKEYREGVYYKDNVDADTINNLEIHDDIVGREEDINALRILLMSEGNSDPYLIGIEGEPGIGKTALVKKVYNDTDVKSYFDCYAWIPWGCTFDTMTTQLLKDILSEFLCNHLDQLSYTEDATIIDAIHADIAAASYTDDDDDETMKRKLYDFLENKRYLIVIEQFAMSKHWDEFFISTESPTPRGLKGSRVLLSSDIFTLDEMQLTFGHRYKVGPLSEANSWEMFISKVCNPNPLRSPELVSIAKHVVRKCEGMPFLIHALVEQLSEIDNTYEAWLNVLSTRDKRNETHEIDEIISSLPLHMQRCVSYLQLFPKNYEIPVRRLIALWIAEEMVISENDLPLQHIGKGYLQQMIDKEIVQVKQEKIDGRPKTCSLNELWHQRLLSRSNQSNHEESSTTLYATTVGIRRLPVYHTNNIDPRLFSSRNISLDPYRFLLSFLCFDYRKSFEPSRQVKDFFRRGIDKNCFLSLKVLDLEGVYKPVLPKEIERLTNLRYLGLRWTYIDTIPSFISNLFNLRTLDLKHTYVNTFPKWICKMQHLQHLYMSENHRGKFVYRAGSLGKLQSLPGAGSLEKLETLWGIFVDEESHVKDGLDRLTDIRDLGLTYRLTSQQDQDVMAQWILKLQNLQSLRVKSKDQRDKSAVLRLMPFENHVQLTKLYLLGALEKTIKEYAFPPCLVKLTLSASKLMEDPMPTLGKLPKLTTLRLYSDSYIGTSMVCSSSSFVQLKVLKMWKLEQLDEWIVEEGSMPTLKELDIRSCKRLDMLPVELQEITTARDLKLTDMSKKFMEQVKNDKGWSKKDNICFTDWDISANSSARTASGSFSSSYSNSTNIAPGASESSSSATSPSSSLGQTVLLLLLARRGVAAHQKTHATLNRIPAP